MKIIALILALTSTQAFGDILNCDAYLFGRHIYSLELNRQTPPYMKVSTPNGWVAEGIPSKSGRGDTSYYLAIGDSSGFEFSIAEGDRDFALCPKSNECYRCQ